MNEHQEVEQQLSQMRPCPKCSELVHPDNTGFHVCKQMGLPTSNPVTCLHMKATVRCPDCGIDIPVAAMQMAHLSKGGADPDTPVYSARSVEALISIALAAAKMGSASETSGYSQEYADNMRTALLRIQGIAMEPGQQGNREIQMRNISCLASDGLLGVDRGQSPVETSTNEVQK